MTEHISTKTPPSNRRVPFAPPRTASLGLAQVVGQGLAVVTAVLLARRLGVSGFGVYAFVSAAVFVANVATTFGTDMVLIREVAQEQRLDRCASALSVQLGLSIVAILVLAGASAVVGPGADEFVAPIRIFSLSLLPAAWFSVSTALLRGLGMMRTYAGLVVAAAAMPLAGVATFVRRGDSLVRTMTVLLAAQCAVAFVAVACCAKPLRLAKPTLRPGRAEIVAMVRESRTIGGLSLIGVLYQRLAMLGVSFFVGPTATGWYSGASRIVEASKTGHVALAGAAYPLMAEDDKRPGDRDRELVLHRSRQLCLVSGAVVSITLVLVGPFLVDHLYGSAFASARTAVVILALGVVPSTLATFQSLALFAQHRERDVLRVMSVCIGVLVVAMAALMPTVGWIGACWAMLIADISQAALLTSHSRDRA